MSVKTDLCNEALSHLGTSKEIEDFDNDRTEEARACRRFYDRTLRDALRSYPWPFARSKAALALLADYTTTDRTPPNDEWNYAYAFPEDAIQFIRIWNGLYTDDNENVVHYEFNLTPTGRLILTNQPLAVGLWISKNALNEALLPDDFLTYFTYLLAGKIAPRLPGIGSVNLRTECLQLAATWKGTAMAAAENEEKRPRNSISSIQKARMGLGGRSRLRRTPLAGNSSFDV